MRSELVVWLSTVDPVVLVVAGVVGLVGFRLLVGYVEEVLARRAWLGRRLDRFDCFRR